MSCSVYDKGAIRGEWGAIRGEWGALGGDLSHFIANIGNLNCADSSVFNMMHVAVLEFVL